MDILFFVLKTIAVLFVFYMLVVFVIFTIALLFIRVLVQSFEEAESARSADGGVEIPERERPLGPGETGRRA